MRYTAKPGDTVTNLAGALLGGETKTNRDAIVNGAKAGVERIGLGGATITNIEVQDSGPQLTASLRIFSTHQRLDGRPTPSDWQMVWEDPGRGWVVTEVEDGSVTEKNVFLSVEGVALHLKATYPDEAKG